MLSIYAQQALDTTSALEVITLALSHGAEAGVAVSAAVVDPGMELIAFARASGATPHSALTSRAKANTAASTRRDTGWMGPELDPAIAIVTGGRLTNIVGGVPILVDGVVVGALGIAGGTPSQDAELATRTVQALTAA